MKMLPKLFKSYAALPDDDSEGKQPMMKSFDEESSSCDTITSSYDNERRNKSRKTLVHFVFLYLLIAVLLSCLVWKDRVMRSLQASAEIWSPAQHVVRYETIQFGKYFNEKSPYTQMPSKELDEKWEDLYNFGLSELSEDEAAKLLDPTAHLPHDDSKYVVTLAVFHQLHCVNHLRKALYPDEYPGLWQYHENGTVNHDTILALHWDHCLDILRQAIMCQSDITPMPFWYRESDDNIYSALETTHYCRNFDDIRTWAKGRQITHWETNGGPKKAEQVV